MPKKSSTSKRRSAPPPPTGDIPWMLSCEEDKWHAIEIDLEDMDMLTPLKIPSPKGDDKEWSCYNINMSVDGGDFEEHEVPFWAMKPFHAETAETWERNDQDTMELLYKRTSEGKVNTAHFGGA